MDISFIVTVYNKDVVLFNQCINSIIKLKNYQYEVIVIDDGSDSNLSAEYVKCIKKKNFKIRYYRKANEGVSLARNYGIEKANGKYVYFVDADDVLVLTEQLLKSVIEEKDDVIITNVQQKRENNAIVFSLPVKTGEIGAEEILPQFVNNNLLNWSVAKFYSKQFLLHNKLEFNKKIIVGEDFFFVYKAIKKAKSIKYISQTSYVYLYSDITGTKRNLLNPKKVLENTYDVYLLKSKIMLKTNQDTVSNQKRLSSEIINSLYSIYRDLVLFNKSEANIYWIYIWDKLRQIRNNSPLGTKELIKVIIVKHNLKYAVKLFNFLKKFDWA